jgi:hypothetical protein
MISWNEIAENTHIKPMQKWGNTYLNALSSLIGSSTPAPAPTSTQVTVPTATAAAPTLVNTPAPATPTTAPDPAKTIDDKHAAFVYSPGWQTVTTTKAYGGSYRETTQNGEAITIPFTGQSFSLIYKGGITFSKFDVYVDGALVGTLDQKLPAATYQVRWDYPGQFPPGDHTLELVFKVTSATVNRGSFDALIVR